MQETKEKIIEMVRELEDERYIRFVYTFLKELKK